MLYYRAPIEDTLVHGIVIFYAATNGSISLQKKLTSGSTFERQCGLHEPGHVHVQGY